MAKIIIAEFDKVVSGAISLCLKHCGHQVVTALSPSTLHGLIESYNPDLVIVDERYCYEDGRNVCKELKRLYPEKPVMLCANSSDLLAPYEDYGADEVLVLPFDLYLLRTKTEAILSR